MDSQEEIVMTPTKKGKTTHIKIERKKRQAADSTAGVVHVAGGQHQGLVIAKNDKDLEEDLGKPQLQLGFMCFLVDQKTNEHFVESRKLKFWYVDGTDYYNQVTTAYEFFKELVRPENFPRDYVGFIKKCMKQMQDQRYNLARKMDLEIQHLEQGEAPTSPGITPEMFGLEHIDGLGFKKEDTRPIEEIVREKLLTVLESAYPNVLSVEDLVRITGAEESKVMEQLQELKSRELIREMEKGGYVRQVLDEKTGGTEVQMVKQMPTIAANQQPTIAIITANYHEKVAVDAMMDNKTTYVRYKTEGESHVYTTGYIGEHKVVSTKLPQIGHVRAAQISSGSTTTRLLGTFQNIEHVFIVGVTGGVPQFADYYRHPRLGDIIISTCDKKGYIYYHCDKILQDKDGSVNYQLKTWAPRDLELQRLVERIKDTRDANPDYAPWEQYLQEGQELLKTQEANYERPPPESDRLYMSIGDNQVIEVQHPEPPDGVSRRLDAPSVHFGVMGAGRPIRNEVSRHDFANRYTLAACDSEFDQVLESIVGNRKDSFLFVRGVSDYIDGQHNKEWTPYASLAAAAATKAIVKSIPNRQIDDDY
ncbi:uncharacterized protein LOC143276450 isoform X2 [Babylonia areolata]|uniref:uncharacterized protein LOC143276450 isoform X2 n=1 Tax=Babylonia areolata TaxID=304850 RepID=UPI003FD4A9B3